jgi:uncharacterized protein YgbK (DUF1537 family)
LDKPRSHYVETMSRILIIADDLSGAADCASAFAKAGMDAVVVIDRDLAPDATAQVIAIDADSRRMPSAEAARIHRALYARYAAAGQLLYKKIDSTLRGNFAEELAAIATVAGLAIVAPAFPQAGRTTRDGRQYLNGVPLEQSEVWRAEGIAGVAHIPGMLERQGLRTASIGLAELRRDSAGLAMRLASLARQGVQAVVCDIETDDELRMLASAWAQLPMPCFWVGSAGLAEHLAAAAQATASASPAPARLEVTGAILTVVGSLSSVSREQAERLQAATRITRIAVPAGLLRQGPMHAQWSQQQQALDAALAGGRDLLLTIGIEEPVDMSEGVRLCQALAALMAPLASRLGAIVATGGETARAILSAMAYQSLRLAGEIEAGVPLAIAAGPRPLPVITKAGAFGNRDTLLHCHETLAKARLRPAGA